MTLQASGAISLGNIQTEFTGSNPISMSEYVRGGGTGYVPNTTQNNAIPTSTLNMSFSKFYGTARLLDTQVVNVGYTFQDLGFGDALQTYGFVTGVGSCTDGTSNLYGGATIVGLAFEETGGTNDVYFEVQGSRANSGWTNMIINGTTYTRASATYNNGGSTTFWRWDYPPGGNPFGPTGSNATVTWN
jgi:hypothetical protein